MGYVNSSLSSHGRSCLEEGGHRRDWEEVNIMMLYVLYFGVNVKLLASLGLACFIQMPYVIG